MTILAFYRCTVDHSTSLLPSNVILSIILLSTAAIVYFIFVRKEKYTAMYEEFKVNERLNGKLGTIITILYIVITVLLFISLIWLKCK